MARCVFVDEANNTFSVSDTEPSLCGEAGETQVIMAISEYQGITEIFNTETYDVGHSAVVESWVVGLGVGFLLAMVAKLKR